MITLTDTQYYLLFSLLALISIIFLRSFIPKTGTPSNPLHLPPSPPSLPLVGHLHLLTSSLPKSLHILSAAYGPLLRLRLGASNMFLVSSSSTVAELFHTHDLSFASRPSFAFADKLPYKNLGFFATTYGEYWRFMKKLCMTELLSPRQLERSRSIRHEEIERLLHKLLESSLRGEEVDLGADLMRLTNNSICRMAMSTGCSEGDNAAERVRGLVKESLELAAKVCFGDVLGPLRRLGFWLYGKQAIDVTMRYDELLEGMMREHEERGEKEGWEREDKDLMDILLRVYKDEKAELKITRTHVKAFLLDLFIGGTATTAEAMQWAIAEVINRPDVFNKIREELKSVVGNNRLVEESDIPNLPYLQAVIKETLRLYPSVPISTRQCRETCKVKGFDVPEKSMVAINLYAIMRDPEQWDNPHVFWPERFLVPTSPQEEVEVEVEDQISGNKGQNFRYVPFGSGRRRCPGSLLAYSLLNISIAVLVQCFDWKATIGDHGDHEANNKVNMEVEPGLSLARAHPLKCLPILHFNPFVSSN